MHLSIFCGCNKIFSDEVIHAIIEGSNKSSRERRGFANGSLFNVTTVCKLNNASGSKSKLSKWQPGEHKRKFEGNAGGNRWTAGDRALSRAARLFYPVHDNDKMLVPEYSVSPMIHHSARSSARVATCNPRAQWCARSWMRQGSWIEWKPEEASPARRRLVLLMLLGPRCRRTNRRRLIRAQVSARIERIERGRVTYSRTGPARLSPPVMKLLG